MPTERFRTIESGAKFKEIVFEKFVIYPPDDPTGIAAALLRKPDNTHIVAYYLDREPDLSKVDALDGITLFFGPIISYEKPLNQDLILVEAIFDDSRVYVLHGGQQAGGFGIWDTRLLPSNIEMYRMDEIQAQLGLT